MFNQYTYFALLAAKFFGLQDLWSSQNVFGPPTAGCVVIDFKDRALGGLQQRWSLGGGNSKDDRLHAKASWPLLGVCGRCPALFWSPQDQLHEDQGRAGPGCLSNSITSLALLLPESRGALSLPFHCTTVTQIFRSWESWEMSFLWGPSAR